MIQEPLLIYIAIQVCIFQAGYEETERTQLHALAIP